MKQIQTPEEEKVSNQYLIGQYSIQNECFEIFEENMEKKVAFKF